MVDKWVALMEERKNRTEGVVFHKRTNWGAIVANKQRAWISGRMEYDRLIERMRGYRIVHEGRLVCIIEWTSEWY